jgi:G:T-mismatch repair DNA endonuclease (very short patch repair protein)
MANAGPGKRSEEMVQLRFDTGPEIVMTEALKKSGLGNWRTQTAVLGIVPTFVWPDNKVALFADECQRYRCPKHFKDPKQKKGKDGPKEERESRKLSEAGWKVVHTYECEISTSEGASRVVEFLNEEAFKR